VTGALSASNFVGNGITLSNVILSTGTLQANSTAYPNFLYVGSTATVLGNFGVNGASMTFEGAQVLVSTGTLQANTTAYPQFLYVGSTATVSQALMVGSTVTFGGSLIANGSPGTDNYVAFPFLTAGAIATKQVVILSAANTVNTTAVANQTTIAGVTVTSTAGAGTIWVATKGVVTGVTANGVVAVGNLVGTTASAGRAAVTATANAILGRAVTAAAGAGSTFTVLLQ
jgi:hypothetical protein